MQFPSPITVAAIRVGLPGTSPQVYCLAHPVYWPANFFGPPTFLCLAHTVLSGYRFYYNRLITVCH